MLMYKPKEGVSINLINKKNNEIRLSLLVS